MLDHASNGALENEFGTKNEDEVLRRILEQGEVKEQKTREREGNTVCCLHPCIDLPPTVFSGGWEKACVCVCVCANWCHRILQWVQW